ncbi:MAG: Ca-activated chloride channel family protein [Gammaproteobacteria bacterium]|jgi:Ca-activated chloride channel family protein
MKYLFTYLILCSTCLSLQGQTALDMLRAGNKQFMSEQFDEAQKSYQKALEIDDSYSFAMFNLGNTFFVNEDFDQAQSQFENAARTATNKIEKSNAYYNLGSSYVSTAIKLAQEAKENPGGENEGDPYSYLKKGVDAYKDALRNNSMDEDARYNLAYLQNLLKQQPPPSDQEQEGEDSEDQDGEKSEDEQENQEPKDGEGDEDEEKEEKSDEGDEDKNQEDQEEKEKPKPKELSKEEAERILEAIDKQEKDIREKMNLKKAKGERIKIEKDW